MIHAIRFLFFSYFCGMAYAQVGINTTDPQGMLDINSTTMGVVLPRVTSIEDVTNADGSTPPVNGTVVYDILRDRVCHRINNNWICIGIDGSGEAVTEVEIPVEYDNSTYFKASNTATSDLFGHSVSASDDGTRFAVGAAGEDSNATGINGNQADNSASSSGAVYVFALTGGVWIQEAYIKASNTDASDTFALKLSISGDGLRVAIAANGEDSNATGINGDDTNNSFGSSGAVYIFVFSGGVWSQEAYIKASNTGGNDRFGWSTSITNDGSILVVGAIGEDSDATGINGDETNNSLSSSGAAYVFSRSGTTWSQEAYIKAAVTDINDQFGSSVAISGDGTRLAISAIAEDSNARGLNGDASNDNSLASGAVYGFDRSGATWSQTVFIKSSNSDASDRFGDKLSLSNDGSFLFSTTYSEKSNAIGINGNQTDNSLSNAGATYLITPF